MKIIDSSLVIAYTITSRWKYNERTKLQSKERGSLMNGKSKCKLLKQIRQQIADNNDIAYVTSECKYQGECTGTCPKCEAEVRYLEQELSKRRQLGKSVAVAGVAAALVVGMSGCDFGDLTTSQTLSGDVEIIQTQSQPIEGEIVATEELLKGDVPFPTYELQGLAPFPDDEITEAP